MPLLWHASASKVFVSCRRYAEVGEEIRHREVVRVPHGTSDESVRRRIEKGTVNEIVLMLFGLCSITERETNSPWFAQ